MVRINYTDEFKKEVINARYKHGISLRQLTKIYKVSMPTIIKWSKEYSLSLIHISEPTRPY